MTTPTATPQAQPLLRVDVADGKYTVVQSATGELRALRYGEDWRDFTGDKLVGALAYALDAARAETEAVRRELERTEQSRQRLAALAFVDVRSSLTWRSLAAELVEGLALAKRRFELLAAHDNAMRNGARPSVGASEAETLIARARALGIGEKEKAGGFYLQDSRSYVGNCVLWWRDGGGYTTRLHEAQVFTKEEATRLHANRATDVPWPVAAIRGIQHSAVDAQRLPKKDTRQ